MRTMDWHNRNMKILIGICIAVVLIVCYRIVENNLSQPLAARLRPKTLDEYVGQTHLLGKGKVLRRLIESDQISSMIFWGPPGVGKTTLARIIANTTKAAFIDFSAVTSGIKEIRYRQ